VFLSFFCTKYYPRFLIPYQFLFLFSNMGIRQVLHIDKPMRFIFFSKCLLINTWSFFYQNKYLYLHRNSWPFNLSSQVVFTIVLSTILFFYHCLLSLVYKNNKIVIAHNINYSIFYYMGVSKFECLKFGSSNGIFWYFTTRCNVFVMWLWIQTKVFLNEN
jgi:hypothetical protein